jgi:peroxiredoxin
MSGHVWALRYIVAAAIACVVVAGPAAALQVGERAPDFTLTRADGKAVKLADLLGKGPVLIYTFIQVFNAP